MTLEDRLDRLATRTPPGDPADILAAARTRAEHRRPRRNRGLLPAAAAAVVAIAVVGAALGLRDSGDNTVTVAGPDDPSADETTTPEHGDWPPRSGQDCPGLVSETVWTRAVVPADLQPPAAGGEEGYQETVTNTGDEPCSIIFNECPAPGALFSADGQRVTKNQTVCNAMAYPPETLAPGESRTETWTVTLATPPGDYELRVPQRDGTLTTLPITLDDNIPACPEEAVEMRSEPEYEQYTPSGAETHPQLLFATTAEEPCTLRIARTTLALRPADGSDDEVSEFADEQRRWYAASPDAGVLYEPSFGSIDLAPAQYEGTITVELDSGAAFTHPARLLVGGAGDDGSEDPPPPAPTPEGATAVWAVSDTEPPNPTNRYFTAVVTRLECSSGETGEVRDPAIAVDGDRIVVTFAVEPLPDGEYTCPSNNLVPYVVELDEPLGNRDLVDGACLSGEAASTSHCSGGAVRWSPPA